MSSPMSQTPPGPPYASHYANLGGRPSIVPDVPIAACLIPFYIAGAVLNMYHLQVNLRRGHKFIISGAIFGFCMTRITALTMRIVWANFPDNVKIAIATNIFTNAGVIIFFVVNVVLAQRILRAHHPEVGWSKGSKIPFIFIYFSFFASLVLLITSIVDSSFTLDKHVQSQLRDIRLFASTYLAVLTFVPIPIVLWAVFIPHTKPIDDFGKKGTMRTRILLVLFTATLLCLGASFRAGVSYYQRPLNNPGWFNSKAAFYCFNFAIELTVLYTYTLFRIDLRYHVPDDSSAPGHYSRGPLDKKMSLSEPNDIERQGGTEAEREENWDHQLDSELPRRDYEMAEAR